MKNIRLVPVVLCVALLAACATWTLVEGPRVEMGGVYTVMPAGTWNSRSEGDRVFWTVDGPGLQQLIFFNGIEGGDALFSEAFFASASDKQKRHRFKPSMDFFQIDELVSGTWAGLDWQRVETKKLRPAPFGPFEGFRLELSCLNPEGLDYRGLVAGAIVEERLYLMVYLATRFHFYDTSLAQVEAILRSIEAS